MLDAGEVLYQSLSNIGRMYAAGVQDQIDRKRKLEDIEAARAFDEKQAQKYRDFQSAEAKAASDRSLANEKALRDYSLEQEDKKLRAQAKRFKMPNADSADIGDVAAFVREEMRKEDSINTLAKASSELKAAEELASRSNALDAAKYKAGLQAKRDELSPTLKAAYSRLTDEYNKVKADADKVLEQIASNTPEAITKRRMAEYRASLPSDKARKEFDSKDPMAKFQALMMTNMAGGAPSDASKEITGPLVRVYQELQDRLNKLGSERTQVQSFGTQIGFDVGAGVSSSGMFGGGNTPPPPPAPQATTTPKNPEAGSTLPGVTNPGSGTALPDVGQEDASKKTSNRESSSAPNQGSQPKEEPRTTPTETGGFLNWVGDNPAKTAQVVGGTSLFAKPVATSAAQALKKAAQYVAPRLGSAASATGKFLGAAAAPVGAVSTADSLIGTGLSDKYTGDMSAFTGIAAAGQELLSDATGENDRARRVDDLISKRRAILASQSIPLQRKQELAAPITAELNALLSPANGGASASWYDSQAYRETEPYSVRPTSPMAERSVMPAPVGVYSDGDVSLSPEEIRGLGARFWRDTKNLIGVGDEHVQATNEQLLRQAALLASLSDEERRYGAILPYDLPDDGRRLNPSVPTARESFLMSQGIPVSLPNGSVRAPAYLHSVQTRATANPVRYTGNFLGR